MRMSPEGTWQTGTMARGGDTGLPPRAGRGPHVPRGPVPLIHEQGDGGMRDAPRHLTTKKGLKRQRQADAQDRFAGLLFGLFSIVAVMALRLEWNWGLVATALVSAVLAWAAWTGRFYG